MVERGEQRHQMFRHLFQVLKYKTWKVWRLFSLSQEWWQDRSFFSKEHVSFFLFNRRSESTNCSFVLATAGEEIGVQEKLGYSRPLLCLLNWDSTQRHRDFQDKRERRSTGLSYLHKKEDHQSLKRPQSIGCLAFEIHVNHTRSGSSGSAESTLFPVILFYQCSVNSACSRSGLWVH